MKIKNKASHVGSKRANKRNAEKQDVMFYNTTKGTHTKRK